MMDHLRYLVPSTLFVTAAVFLLVRFGWNDFVRWLGRMEQRFDTALNQQLLLDVNPRMALILAASTVLVIGFVGFALMSSVIGFILGVGVALFAPWGVLVYLESKRRTRLEQQLVDGIVALASGVRAGLNLVQSMELLVVNSTGPIKQEFSQLLREYNMGLDLNQCMRNASDRIGLSNYRLLFTAIEMHRRRGGDTGESLDRIAESIREIQRLEGKLDAITSQGRMQARMMAGAGVVLIGIYALIDPEGVALMMSDPRGRVFLLIAAAMIAAGFWWINRIMAVDI